MLVYNIYTIMSVPQTINPLSTVKLSKHAAIGGSAKDHIDKTNIVAQIVGTVKTGCGDLAPLKADPSFLQYVVSQVLNMASKTHDIEAIVVQVMVALFNLTPAEQDIVKLSIKFLTSNGLSKKTGILGKAANYAKKKVGLS